VQPHPDFADDAPPRSADLGAFRLAPLGPDVTEEDFAAVTGSVGVLRGLFGNDWPDGLTLEEDRIDLAWHEREFTLARSFAWVLRDGGGVYLGCAYVFPAPGERGRGQVFMWLVETPERQERLAAWRPVLEAWLARWLPEGGGYVWRVNDQN
jgi:hypothetical protein